MNEEEEEILLAGSPSCALCSTPLLTGSLRYITEVAVTADFDPLLVIPDDLDGEIDRTLAGMQEAANEGLAGKLEEQVVARRAFLLCPRCRAGFLDTLPGKLQ